MQWPSYPPINPSLPRLFTQNWIGRRSGRLRSLGLEVRDDSLEAVSLPRPVPCDPAHDGGGQPAFRRLPSQAAAVQGETSQEVLSVLARTGPSVADSVQLCLGLDHCRESPGASISRSASLLHATRFPATAAHLRAGNGSAGKPIPVSASQAETVYIL